jgi:hypothetical protein
MPGFEDAGVRDLCRKIAQENDPQRIRQLLGSLRAAIREEHEEARLRMGQIVRHYRKRILPRSHQSGVTRSRGLRGLLELELGLTPRKDPGSAEA